MTLPKLAIKGGTPLIDDGIVLKHNWANTSLENALSLYTGANHVQCVSSGTAALVSSLYAVGVRPGDEVITVSYTWVATISAILHLNAVPVFVDIDPNTFCIDYNLVEEKITKKTKAILAVDIYGHPAPILELMKIGKKNNIPVIEDACQASTAKIFDSYVGNIADITAFSWAGKPISSAYGGGAYLTNNKNYYERGMLAGQHPFYIREKCTLSESDDLWSMGGLGHNFRPEKSDALHSLLQADLNTQKRQENCQYLTDGLKNIPWIKTPEISKGYYHAYHFYVCLWDETNSGVSRNRFCEAITAEGLNVWAYINMISDFSGWQKKTNWITGPIHTRPLFKNPQLNEGRFVNNINYQECILPNTEKCSAEEFCIPQELISAPNSKEDMELIVKIIKKVVDNIDELK